MTISFFKPYGAHADCKEMEYIATLHQTGNKIRSDGSVTAEDVSNFLVSRHGIRVDLNYVKEYLMPSLAGAMDESSEAVFDIVELTSMLLIPHLRNMGALEDEYDVSDFFGKVLGMIISDVTGEDDKQIVLNRDMMREIMEFYGEEDVNDNIIDEMLRAAGADPKQDTSFDYRALLAATTSDIQQVKLDWDSTITTHYDDVLDGTTLDCNLEDNDPDEEISKSQFDNAGKQVQRIFTFPTIDFVAENYRSKTFNIILWLLVIFAFFAYAFEFQTTVGSQDCSATFNSEFGCRIVNSIISWLLIFAQLTIVGSIFIALSSAGNSIYLQHNISSLVGVLLGMVSIITSCILSYLFEFKLFLINTVKEEDNQYTFAYLFTLFLGCVLLLYQLKALLYVIVPRWVYKRLPFSGFFLSADMARCERLTKQAATFKVGKMVENAIGHHEDAGTEKLSHRLRTRTSAGQALLNFQATVDVKEPMGGIIPTLKNMLNGSLFKEEGVWLHARLYAMNLSQWFIAFFYLILYVGAFRYLNTDDFSETLAPTASPASFVTQDLVDALAPYYITALDELVGHGEEFLSLWWANLTDVRPDLVTVFGGGILNSTSAEVIKEIANHTSVATLTIFLEAAANKVNFGAILNATSAADAALDDVVGRFLQEESGDDFMAMLIPTRGVTLFALSMGAVAAFVATVSLAMVWLPSSVTTIQQFRYGVIPSLHDPSFQQYRSGPDLTTILFGSTFWGTFYSSGVIFIIIGCLSFVLAWELTRAVAMHLLAHLIGIFVTIAFKMLIVTFFRKALFVGFYRKRPAGGNFMLLIFECWSLGLTLGTMSIRMVKLIMISAFYIGRLDTPLFAPGVGCIGPISLDSYPIQFRKDLLLHEAHRHPYMERLAVIYILKLRYGDDFGTRAGGAWRLIATMALMPWIRRYRLDDSPATDGSDGDAKTKKEEANTDAEIKPSSTGTVRNKHKELTRLRNYVKELESKLERSEFGQHVEDTVRDEFLMNEITTNTLNFM